MCITSGLGRVDNYPRHPIEVRYSPSLCPKNSGRRFLAVSDNSLQLPSAIVGFASENWSAAGEEAAGNGTSCCRALGRGPCVVGCLEVGAVDGLEADSWDLMVGRWQEDS